MRLKVGYKQEDTLKALRKARLSHPLPSSCSQENALSSPWQEITELFSKEGKREGLHNGGHQAQLKARRVLCQGAQTHA